MRDDLKSRKDVMEKEEEGTWTGKGSEEMVRLRDPFKWQVSKVSQGEQLGGKRISRDAKCACRERKEGLVWATKEIRNRRGHSLLGLKSGHFIRA